MSEHLSREIEELVVTIIKNQREILKLKNTVSENEKSMINVLNGHISGKNM